MIHFTRTRRRTAKYTDNWFCSRVALIESLMYYVPPPNDPDIHIYSFLFSFFHLLSFYYYFVRILIRHGLGEHRLRKRIKTLIR